ncbi:hypothetical protein GSI_10420 [Ganoderma sinense ZZ0214-1]|uniref:Uncharacterized protein n=1 Tax=Ganoderma sinense ZZ0214-1 TaxID=1077348 RepID=A0A2G8S0G7_9APHY|nr:hypothetical protein GSI_10420 [Ganoderma sinense ZZ0214-1]
MSLSDYYLNSNAFDDVDHMTCVFQGTIGVKHANRPSSRTTTTTSTGQVGEHVSLWTASFPPDVLGKIFVDVRDMTHADHPNCQSAWLRLTRICHSWRRVALNTPALWTHLRIYDTRYPEELELLLALSGDLPVDVELDFVKSRFLADLDFKVSIVRAVWTHGRRITNFSVVCSTEDTMPIRSVETTIHFPNGTEVFLEPQACRTGSIVRLQGGSFPRPYEPLQDVGPDRDVSKVFRAVGMARRLRPMDYVGFWQDFGLQIPLVLLDFWSLTHLHLEYCGPRDKQGSVMEKIFLPPAIKTLVIKDEPWEMVTLLEHIFFPSDARGCKGMRIKLAVDLQNSMYCPKSALEDLLRACRWPSIYYHVSACTTALLNLSSDATLTLAGLHIGQGPKFQFDFFNGPDRGAILELAADTLNNFFNVFAPLEAPLFSKMEQLSIHDASGELGRLVDWETLLSRLPLDVRSLSLGNAHVVANFLVAMDRQAQRKQAARDSGSSIGTTNTLRLSRLAWCVESRSLRYLSRDVAIMQRCRALDVLEVEEIVLRAPRRVGSGGPTSLDSPSSPLPSPPPSEDGSPLDGGAKRLGDSKARIRILVEDSKWCSICPRMPRSVPQPSTQFRF